MPQVFLKYRRDVPDGVIYKLAQDLPEIVARELDCGGQGALIANDVEVTVLKKGPYDVMTRHIEIIIWANDYPKRRANLKKRQQKIAGAVRKITNHGGWIWVLLGHGAFGQFGTAEETAGYH